MCDMSAAAVAETAGAYAALGPAGGSVRGTGFNPASFLRLDGKGVPCR